MLGVVVGAAAALTAIRVTAAAIACSLNIVAPHAPREQKRGMRR